MMYNVKFKFQMSSGNISVDWNILAEYEIKTIEYSWGSQLVPDVVKMLYWDGSSWVKVCHALNEMPDIPRNEIFVTLLTESESRAADHYAQMNLN